VIAGDLGLSPKTVEVHRGNIITKMKAKNSVELATIVTKFGLIKGFSLVE
jgi:DNA-binding NarL/FixJ family response regulator